jgi:glyoxylase-like metal-dependent hydrolase (beta-lactamase superfamily II)
LNLGSQQLRIGVIVSRPFDENTYIAHFDGREDCVVVDPGLDPVAVEDYLIEHDLVPTALLCTHGHSDHIAGNRALKSRWPECPIIIGTGDAEKLIDSELNLSAPFGFPITSLPADQTVREGDHFVAAGLELDVFEAPGHSIGHVVFLCKQVKPWRLFGGDVLFQGSIGRTDFPDGSFECAVRSTTSCSRCRTTRLYIPATDRRRRLDMKSIPIRLSASRRDTLPSPSSASREVGIGQYNVSYPRPL